MLTVESRFVTFSHSSILRISANLDKILLKAQIHGFSDGGSNGGSTTGDPQRGIHLTTGDLRRGIRGSRTGDPRGIHDGGSTTRQGIHDGDPTHDTTKLILEVLYFHVGQNTHNWYV